MNPAKIRNAVASYLSQCHPVSVSPATLPGRHLSSNNGAFAMNDSSAISRREALAAVIGGAVAGTIPAAEPAAALSNGALLKSPPLTDQEVNRIASRCRCRYPENHPAVEKAVLALTLLDLSFDHAFNEYRDLEGIKCQCGDCRGIYNSMIGMEWIIDLLRDVLAGNLFGGRATAVAHAPEYFREWMLHLAEECEDGLRQLKSEGQLGPEWNEPLADLEDAHES